MVIARIVRFFGSVVTGTPFERPARAADRLLGEVTARFHAPFDARRMTTSGNRPWVVLASARSGSTLLVRGAARVWPSVSTEGEAFDQRRRQGRSVSAVISSVYFQPSVQQVGCKILHHQLRPGSMRRVVRLPGMRVIILRRRNLVRQYVSLHIAHRHAQWALLDERERPSIKDRQVSVTLHDLVEYESTLARAYDVYARLTAHLQPLHLDYEDLEENLEAQLDRVGVFLGVSEAKLPLDLGLIRQNPEPLTALIANYDELLVEMIEAGRTDLVQMMGE